MRELERELKDKEAELAKLQSLLNGRKELLAKSEGLQAAPIHAPNNPIATTAGTAADLRYEHLNSELKEIKMRLQNMNENQNRDELFQKNRALAEQIK